MCDCGGQDSFDQCCGRFISGKELAPSAEALMRSRYTAFYHKNMDYLRQTTDPQTRMAGDDVANRQWAESVQFKGLEIIRSEEAGNKAIVEFRASFVELATSQEHVHHELSKFRKQAGVWYFREGKVRTP
jgi:SEC-C motif-containing protein